MANQTWVNVGGTWKKVKNVWAKVGGVWKNDVMPKVNILGTWRETLKKLFTKIQVEWAIVPKNLSVPYDNEIFTARDVVGGNQLLINKNTNSIYLSGSTPNHPHRINKFNLENGNFEYKMDYPLDGENTSSMFLSNKEDEVLFVSTNRNRIRKKTYMGGSHDDEIANYWSSDVIKILKVDLDDNVFFSHGDSISKLNNNLELVSSYTGLLKAKIITDDNKYVYCDDGFATIQKRRVSDGNTVFSINIKDYDMFSLRYAIDSDENLYVVVGKRIEYSDDEYYLNKYSGDTGEIITSLSLDKNTLHPGNHNLYNTAIKLDFKNNILYVLMYARHVKGDWNEAMTIAGFDANLHLLFTVPLGAVRYPESAFLSVDDDILVGYYQAGNTGTTGLKKYRLS